MYWAFGRSVPPKRNNPLEWETAPDMGLSHLPMSKAAWSAVCGVTLLNTDIDTEDLKPRCPLCLEGQ